MTPANSTDSVNTIYMLNGSNFKSWKENLEIVLGMMDLDFALREDFPPALTDKSTSEQKREKEMWEKSNREDPPQYTVEDAEGLADRLALLLAD
ncbi:UNVERIFIED_CONTAM: hypothetical protein Scaly_2044000 [Sesamum calycinum]|uniref:Retrotransposon Copia-like N-terminal domain-containing protein n=1 Tax=Sesamum calycinum TaxID=2727403 RepID=A0AAW2N3Y3_9LAMI